MRYSKQEVTEAREKLLSWLKPGDTVYTIVRHVSRSGMMRDIGLVVFLKGDPNSPIHPNYAAAVLLGWTPSKDRDAVKAGGCGMDVGFHLVYELSHALFNDGYALTQRWL